LKLFVAIFVLLCSRGLLGEPAESFKVFPGDIITGSVSPYFTGTSGYTAATASTMATALSAVLAGGTAAIDGGITTAYATTGNPLIALGGFGGSTFPSGYLNYILFDENYVPIRAKSFPVQNLPSTRHTIQFDAPLEVKELGYLFVYLSYDNNQSSLYLYFDDLKVVVDESPLIQVNNYYPFGMVSNTWLREGEQQNANLFQGKELISQTGWHDFGSRMYWADLGRWFSTDPQKQFSSPYVGMGNMPVVGTDPNGEVFALIPFLLTVAKIYGYASTAYSLAEGFSQGGWQGGLQALSTSAFSFGVGLIIGPIVGSLVPKNIYGYVPGALAGAASGALSGGLVGGLTTMAGGGEFSDGFESGAISGGITGGLAGFQKGDTNAKSSKYERNRAFGNLTEKGYDQVLSDAIKSTWYLNNMAGSPSIRFATNETLPADMKAVGGKIRLSDGRTARAVTERILDSRRVNEQGETIFESKIWVSKSALRSISKVHDILGHEMRHAYHNKSGLYSQWYDMQQASGDYQMAYRLSEAAAYRWQIGNGYNPRFAFREYRSWQQKYYGN